jgi:glycerol uptake facilitator-like aquaporin
LEDITLGRRIGAEALGTALLLATVIGSGVMGDTLAAGNDAVALLGNTIATGAILYVLITVFGPISGAHFNPAVTLAFTLRGELAPSIALIYVATQLVAGACGVLIAHLMFDLPIMQVSTTARAGLGQLTGEFVATFGLLLTIFGCLSSAPKLVAPAVGLFITAGYWFTSSTSFANPAVTVARTLSDTFAGIAPADAPGFIVTQLLAAILAVGVFRWLFPRPD